MGGLVSVSGRVKALEGAHSFSPSRHGAAGAGLGARLRSLNALCVYIPTGLVNLAADKVFRCNRERPRDLKDFRRLRRPMVHAAQAIHIFFSLNVSH